MKKEYTFEDLMKARDEERNRIRIIMEYILNKNSHSLPRGVDFVDFFHDMQDFETTLLD